MSNVPRTLPDINASATLEAAAVVTIIVWLLSLDKVTVDGEVSAALVTTVSALFGFIRGTKWNRQRRANDPPNGGG